MTMALSDKKVVTRKKKPVVPESNSDQNNVGYQIHGRSQASVRRELLTPEESELSVIRENEKNSNDKDETSPDQNKVSANKRFTTEEKPEFHSLYGQVAFFSIRQQDNNKYHGTNFI